MDFLHLKASENSKINDEISNMKSDIDFGPFVPRSRPQELLALQF